MTEGNILKRICFFAAPCILSRVLQNLYTLLDSVIVGQAIDANALAAVGATTSIISLFTDTVIGLMSGFSVTAANKYGSRNSIALRKVFSNSFAITLLVSILVTCFGVLFSRNILVLLNTPPEILDGAELYLKIIFVGISASFFYNFFCEMLRALGNSRQPLYFLIFSSVLHILFIGIFIYGFHMGIVGAALSTVISQLLAVLMTWYYMNTKVPCFHISFKDISSVVKKPDVSVLKECLHIGIPMAVTNFVVAFGVIILSFITNGIGVEYVTAYSCASKIGYIITTPIFGFATAVSVFASQNLGAGHIIRIKEGVRKVSILVTAINLVLFLMVLFAARPLLTLLIKDSPIAVEAGVSYLFIRCTAMFVLTFAAIFKNVLAALGKPLFPTVSGFLEIAVRYIIPITLAPTLGFFCVPLTDASTWLMLAILLTPAYVYEIKNLQKQMQRANV